MTKPIDTNEMRSNVNMYEWTDEEIFAMCDEIDRLRDEIDRLRGEKQTPPQGKMVRVRIPCVVGTKGGWMGGGTSEGLLSFLTDQAPEDQAASMLDGFEHDTGDKGVIRWLTADLPVPEKVTVEAEVHAATNDETVTSGGRG